MKLRCSVPAGAARASASCRQREVIEADLHVARVEQPIADDLVERTLVGADGHLIVFEAALRRLDPGHAREAVDGEPIGPEGQHHLGEPRIDAGVCPGNP